jgi:hypothetical protein
LSFSPVDLVSAHPWRRTVFTTYSLSLSFFEAVLLDALVRGEAREALVLSDALGVKAALGEQGARRVGKDYNVEPVSVTNGVFHPKISVFVGEGDCHLLVGSGNLTFGGWGGNYEVIEHVHSALAPEAIEDAATFFALMASSDRVRHSAATQCETIAHNLRASVRGRPRNGNIRLFHSLDGAISDKLIQAADELGGATRLMVAAPFWDAGTAIDNLCDRLGLSEVLVHAHPGGTVEGRDGSNWPKSPRVHVKPAEFEVFAEEKPRRLHAKVFEILCRRGRLVASGSPNASGAALGAGGNVEACVVRFQREAITGWSFNPTEPPELAAALDDENEGDEVEAGVLTATLEGERIKGQVLTPAMTGTISVFQLTDSGSKMLGETEIKSGGHFALKAPGLEVESWTGGRLVLQVQGAPGKRAEGFVSVSAFAEITRLAGPLAPRLLALLAGAEVPHDVAIIMEWFHDDPDRLLGATRARTGGGSEGESEGRDERRTIDVDTLNSAFAIRVSDESASEGTGGARWRRFLDHVLAAFREKRGPFRQPALVESDDDEDLGDTPVDATTDPAVPRLMESFGRLFDLLISEGNAPQHALMAFDLTCYMCERLQPDVETARAWLERLLVPLAAGAWPTDRIEDIAAAIVIWAGFRTDAARIRNARGRLLRLGYSVQGEPPSLDRIRGFEAALRQHTNVEALWQQIRSTRTLPEQVRVYLTALKAGCPSTGYEDLRQVAREDWPILEKAIVVPGTRNKMRILDGWTDTCPRCNIGLPPGDAIDLRSIGIAKARGCCGNILINESV